MPAITPAYQIVNPSYIMPEMILSYQQASGAFSVMASGNPLVRLADGDQYVYMKRLDIRTQVTSSQSGNANQLPSVALEARMVSTPTYMFRARAIYDHHDMAAAGNWGIALPEAQRLGTRQAIFQQMRNALLYGMNPAGGEGVLNTNGATTINLPADSGGNTTVLTIMAKWRYSCWRRFRRSAPELCKWAGRHAWLSSVLSARWVPWKCSRSSS